MKKLHKNVVLLSALSVAFQSRFPHLSVRNDVNPEEQLKAINKALEDIGGKLKTHAENSIKEMDKLGKDMKAETKKEIDALLITQNGLLDEQTKVLARLGDVEQKVADWKKNLNTQQNSGKILTLGQQFVNHEEFIEQAKNFTKGNINIQVKKPAILNAITSGDASGGALVEPQRLGVVQGPTRELRVRDLLIWGRTTKGDVEFPKEETFTNNADAVSENPVNGKPESDLTYTLESEKVRTLAHWIKASKQVLDDAPMLAAMINTKLTYGLLVKEEDQIMKGSGTGQELHGLFTQAVSYVQPSGIQVTTENRIDRIRLAMLQIELADYKASAITLNPTDWTNIELLKNGNLNYLFSNPFGMTTPMLWGKPVVPTKSLDFDEFMVGDFQNGAMGWDREDANVAVSNIDGNDFTKNMVTILAELREAITVYQNAAFVKGTFDGLNGSN